MKRQFTTERHNMFNSCYLNKYKNPLTDQYKLFLRDIKPLRDVCLNVEYTVLFLPFIFSLVSCALCVGNGLYIFCLVFFSISLLFFSSVLIHFTIDLTLLFARSTHLITLLWIGLVFITMNPSSLAAVACSISSSTSR